MIQSAFLASLVTLVGAPPLLPTSVLAAALAAIAVPAITVRADEEDGVALPRDTRPLSQRRLAMNRRHRCRARGWTTATALCQVGTSLLMVHLMKVYRVGNPAAPTVGFLLPAF